MSKLALLGGDKYRKEEFKCQRGIEKEEQEAVVEYIRKNNVLSSYRGNYTENFWGGPEVKSLEEEFGEKFDSNPGISVNSCTSGLIVACGAIGIKPGDEVIVTPWSMCCSATAPMVYGGVPVFCDIDYNNFCIDVDKLEEKITPKTKAIIMVDLFGGIPDYNKLYKLKKKYGLYIIEDAAQAIGAKRDNKFAGTFGDVGVFSYTQGKHLTSGEGGMILCNDADLYMKCALLRNHSESVIHDMSEKEREEYSDFNLPGMNLRMTEIQAVIIKEQLKKLDDYVEYRIINVKKLQDKLSEFDFISFPKKECEHSYYVMPFYFHEEKIGISRNKFMEALRAELSGEKGRIDRGIPFVGGYINPLYRFPIFKDRNFNPDDYPITEKLQNKDFCLTLYHALQLNDQDIEDIYQCFKKVVDNGAELI